MGSSNCRTKSSSRATWPRPRAVPSPHDYHAQVTWTGADVRILRPNLSEVEAEQFLVEMEEEIQGRIGEHGWAVLETCSRLRDTRRMIVASSRSLAVRDGGRARSHPGGEGCQRTGSDASTNWKPQTSWPRSCGPPRWPMSQAPAGGAGTCGSRPLVTLPLTERPR